MRFGATGLMSAVTLLVACSSEPTEPSAASRAEDVLEPLPLPATRFRYFGYYWGDSEAHGHHMSEYASFTNVTFINRFYDWPGLVGDAARAHALGLKVIVNVSLCFFDYVDDENYVVKPDWKQYWANTCAPVFRQVGKSAEIFAFFIMDEPQGHNLDVADVETAISAVKQTFPGYRTMVNESPYIHEVPNGMDLYSVGCLPGFMCREDLDQAACLDRQWAFCRQRIERALDATSPSLEFMLTVEASSVGPFVATPLQQRLWERFGAEHSRFIGLAWFLWPNVPPFEGTSERPRVVAHHRDLARAAFARNSWETLPVCGSDGVTYQNPDRAKAEGATIAHYGPCSME